MQGTAQVRTLRYGQYLWGEIVEGTKDDLQSLGLAKGRPYPGEPGCQKRILVARDPRGYKCLIRRVRCLGDGIYEAHIRYPGRVQPENPWIEVAPGVKKREVIYDDEYVGTAEALMAAGLVCRGHLPGEPGARKTTVTIYGDGTVAKSNADRDRTFEPGARRITRLSGGRYMVAIRISGSENERRLAAYKRERAQWEERMRTMPQPAPLTVWRARADVDFARFLGRLYV